MSLARTERPEMLDRGATQGAAMPAHRIARGWRWGLLAVALVATGLGLRALASPDRPGLSLDRWLPWLSPTTVTVYFPDSQGRFLVPVTRRASAKAGLVEQAVSALVSGPRDGERLANPLGAGAALKGVTSDGAAISVDMIAPDSVGTLSPNLAAQALAATLARAGGAQSFTLKVNGAAVVEAAAVPAPAEARYLYYTYGPYLVPVEAGVSSPGEALRQYLAGSGVLPSGKDGLSGLPADVKLLEYRLDTARGLAYANLTYTESVRQMALADPDGMRRTLTGIIATLAQFPEVKAAMLDFEGAARLGLGQCADLLRVPQLMPRTLNDEKAVLGR